MRKTIVFSSTLLLAATASAGVRIETTTRDIKTQVADGGPQIVQVQDGKIRMSNPKDANGVILKNSMFYVLDDKLKTYTEIDKATMQQVADQAGAAMKQMQEQLKNMPPEQRAQMEKMMGGNMAGMMSGKKDVYETKDTGKTDTAEGRKCRVWNLLKNGKVQEELCVVPFSSLPGKEDMQGTFKRLAEAFEGMAANLPGAGDSIKARNAINGYPVRVRSFDDAGKPRGLETVLTKWSEESVPSSAFDVPAGYKKKDLPRMGG